MKEGGEPNRRMEVSKKAPKFHKSPKCPPLEPTNNPQSSQRDKEN